MRLLMVFSCWRNPCGMRVPWWQICDYLLAFAGALLVAPYASAASQNDFILLPLQYRPVMGADGKTMELAPPANDLPGSAKDASSLASEPFQLKNFASLQNQMAMGFLTLTDTHD
jgi:hypothetical protein